MSATYAGLNSTEGSTIFSAVPGWEDNAVAAPGATEMEEFPEPPKTPEAAFVAARSGQFTQLLDSIQQNTSLLQERDEELSLAE